MKTTLTHTVEQWRHVLSVEKDVVCNSYSNCCLFVCGAGRLYWLQMYAYICVPADLLWHGHTTSTIHVITTRKSSLGRGFGHSVFVGNYGRSLSAAAVHKKQTQTSALRTNSERNQSLPLFCFSPALALLEDWCARPRYLMTINQHTCHMLPFVCGGESV